jgi:demethoxyubiquinone hydroxylase (CLK1/Coq7/Cat5 family)
MERFATQIYRTQMTAFDGTPIAHQLADASKNESEHVQKLKTQITQLNGRVYPFGLLFQFMGVLLGLITRLSGKSNLLKANTFVENRAINDYNSFIKTVPFNQNTIRLIRELIKDEELHVINWKKARESLTL